MRNRLEMLIDTYRKGSTLFMMRLDQVIKSKYRTRDFYYYSLRERVQEETRSPAGTPISEASANGSTAPQCHLGRLVLKRRLSRPPPSCAASTLRIHSAQDLGRARFRTRDPIQMTESYTLPIRSSLLQLNSRGEWLVILFSLPLIFVQRLAHLGCIHTDHNIPTAFLSAFVSISGNSRLTCQLPELPSLEHNRSEQ